MRLWDDVPNEVRHHLVSRYLLRHYRPLAEIEGEIFYQRNDLHWTTTSDKRGTLECDWGTVPAFWQEAGPSQKERAIPFQVVKRDGEQLAKITLGVDPARFGTLHFTMSNGAGSEFFLAASESQTRSPADRIRFRALPGDRLATYPVDAGSCHQWYQWSGRDIYLRFPTGVELHNITLSD